MIAVESQHREPWSRWRVMAFMASLSCAARVSVDLYVAQLVLCIQIGCRNLESEDD
jgi:hypothetical protein